MQIVAEASVNGRTPVRVPLQLRGPSDVQGLDPREVLRVQPPAGTSAFEPNHLAYVDLARADLLWSYTPAAAGQDGRLRPWLCLVVVEVQEGVSLTATGTSCPVLRIGPPARPARELPDLTECWAWAHAQVVAADANPASVRGALDSAGTFSRLLSPRVLRPATDYLACVVPVFDLGRRAGLGEDVAEEELTGPHALAPSWSLQPAAPDSVTLPVYVQWRFRTGEGGDFLTLARALRVQDASSVGSRPVLVGRPGFPLPATVPDDTTVLLEGALEPLGVPDAPRWTGGAADGFQTALRPWLDAPDATSPGGSAGPPVLGPPAYGRRHVGRPLLPAGQGQDAGWFEQLNLDPRYRAVAGLGTRAVQEHAEAIVASAWEQAGDLEAGNQRLRQLELSAVTSACLHQRRFVALDDDRLLRVAAPLFPGVRVPTGGAPASGSAGSGRTLVAELAPGGRPLAATSGPMRRLARERGPMTRRLAAQGVQRSAVSWVAVMYRAPAPAGPPPSGLATVRSVRNAMAAAGTVRDYASVTGETVSEIGPLPAFRVLAEGQAVPPAVPAPSAASDSPGAAAFRAAAVAHLAVVDPGRLGVIVDPAPPMPPTHVAGLLRDQLAPRAHLAALAARSVTAGPSAAPAGGRAVGLAASPVFPQPMYELLRDLDPLLLLPGLDGVQADRVVGLRSNARFVESFLLGLNVEVARELLWRGFPTDQRATYADRFWDGRRAGQTRPDITAIDGWGETPLGRHAPPSTVAEPFVLLLRSELLRHYPDAAVYAVPAVRTPQGRVPDDAPAAVLLPSFRGDVPPDVTFFGFDLESGAATGASGGEGWFVVLQEHPGAPVFGLDAGSDTAGALHLPAHGSPPAGLPDGGRPAAGLTWGRNAAHVAGLLRRRPVRLAIHAARLLARG